MPQKTCLGQLLGGS